MMYKPKHICFREERCSACAFELGEQLSKRKPCESAKYVWMVVGSDNPCDIRRYAFSHEQGKAQLSHVKKGDYKDRWTGGIWRLFKLVPVARR